MLGAGRAPAGGLLPLVGAERVDGHLGESQGPAGLVGFGVAVGAYRSPDRGAGRDGRVGVGVAEGDVLLAEGPGFLGPDAGGQA